jgi:Contractile injection system tube protein
MTTLSKATLIPANKGEKATEIKFMFNPTELKFSRSVNIEQSEGSRTSKGQNKTSFKHPNPYQLTISNIILDTYELSGKDQDVLKKLKPFTEAVVYSKGDGSNSKGGGSSGKNKGAGKNQGKDKRPPIYLFTWGTNAYLRCFVKSLNFRLTMFLPDGTPVRAVIDLTLEQVDEAKDQPKLGTPNVSASQRQEERRPTIFE